MNITRLCRTIILIPTLLQMDVTLAADRKMKIGIFHEQVALLIHSLNDGGKKQKCQPPSL